MPGDDPTRNVLNAVGQVVQTMNDLRIAESRRQDDLREMARRHAGEMQALLLDFQEKLRDAESKRIDAIRAVDVNAVAVASDRATDQAAVLANQFQVSADALRALVATTAQALATAQASQASEFAKRVSELERSKYELGGKTLATDPQMAELLRAVQGIIATQARTAGGGAASQQIWGYAFGVCMLILAIASRYIK